MGVVMVTLVVGGLWGVVVRRIPLLTPPVTPPQTGPDRGVLEHKFIWVLQAHSVGKRRLSAVLAACCELRNLLVRPNWSLLQWRLLWVLGPSPRKQKDKRQLRWGSFFCEPFPSLRLSVVPHVPRLKVGLSSGEGGEKGRGCS